MYDNSKLILRPLSSYWICWATSPEGAITTIIEADPRVAITTYPGAWREVLLQAILEAIRLRRWSFFYNDGMVMFFFQGTIAIDGFSMVLPSLDHHH